MDASSVYFLNQCTDQKVELKHGQVIFLGRNRASDVDNILISRKQIQVIANLKDMIVHVKAIGKAISGLNGYIMKPRKCYALHNRDIIELKYGEHKFTLHLGHLEKGVENEEGNLCNTHSSGMKRKAENDINNADTKRLPTPNTTRLFFGSNSQPSKTKGCWTEIDNQSLLVYSPDNLVSKSCIAAFDLDGTIIRTKSGRRFPKDKDDWIFNCVNITSKLKTLHEDDFKLIIFTNQGGIAYNRSKIPSFKEKVEKIVATISLPIQVFIATDESIYRKPAPGMWNALLKHKNDDVPINLEKSFYVGDAAGRQNQHKDHSCADRLFALNIPLTFYTPEEFFLQKAPEKYVMPEFDPRKLKKGTVIDYTSANQEIIVMVGMQASGKSTFCEKHLTTKGYVHISRDKEGSYQKCMSLAEKEVLSGKSVVIDNTNPDLESRARYISIAKKHKVPCRCFVMNTTLEHAKHNLAFRKAITNSRQDVNSKILGAFKNKYKNPELKEGFQEIVQVDFIPTFNSSEEEELYQKFLV